LSSPRTSTSRPRCTRRTLVRTGPAVAEPRRSHLGTTRPARIPGPARGRRPRAPKRSGSYAPAREARSDGTHDWLFGGDDCDASAGLFDNGIDGLDSIEEPDDNCLEPLP